MLQRPNHLFRPLSRSRSPHMYSARQCSMPRRKAVDEASLFRSLRGKGHAAVHPRCETRILRVECGGGGSLTRGLVSASRGLPITRRGWVSRCRHLCPGSASSSVRGARFDSPLGLAPFPTLVLRYRHLLVDAHWAFWIAGADQSMGPTTRYVMSTSRQDKATSAPVST